MSVEDTPHRTCDCGHRPIWHHDLTGCGYHGNGKHQCRCARSSDEVVNALLTPAPQAEGDVREAVDWTRESEHGRCGEWQREGVPSRCALRVSHQGRHDFERSSSGALVDHIRMSVPAMLPGIAQRIAGAVLSSGLVVPVGERDDVLDEMQRVLAERDAALAIVANVRGEIGRWDGYGHGLYNTHYESQLPCAVCDVLDEFRAALDTTPRA